MQPYRYEPGQKPEPLPFVNPQPRVQPQYQKQQYKQPRQPGRSAQIFGRLLYFLVGAGLFSFVWLLLMGTLGTVTGIPALDMFLLFAGIAIFFWGDILTDNNRRWAEKYCGLWGRKGGK